MIMAITVLPLADCKLSDVKCPCASIGTVHWTAGTPPSPTWQSESLSTVFTRVRLAGRSRA